MFLLGSKSVKRGNPSLALPRRKFLEICATMMQQATLPLYVGGKGTKYRKCDN
jgi:hypothetical protein